MKQGNSFLAGLLAGAAVGSIAALLLAPKSGKETREDLRKKLEDLEKEFDNLREKAAGKSEKIKNDLADKLDALRREIDNLAGSI